MAIKLDTINANTWKRVKLQYVTAVAGIALAAGGALAFGGWQAHESAGGPGLSRMELAGSTISRPVQAPREVYYFVNSEAQADYAAYVEEVVAEERELTGARGPTRRVHVLMISSEQQEAATFHLLGEESRDSAGVDFTFIDLRDW
jgi:hypothetical protein